MIAIFCIDLLYIRGSVEKYTALYCSARFGECICHAVLGEVDRSILMERLRRCNGIVGRACMGLAEVLLDRAIPVCLLQRRSLGNYACDVRRTSGERPRTCVIPLVRGRRHQARR